MVLPVQNVVGNTANNDNANGENDAFLVLVNQIDLRYVSH
jgi:hypothetical protein